MSFYWNAFGPVNLGLDLAMLASFFLLARLNRRLQPAQGWWPILRQAALGAVALWVLAGLYVGGIVGVALIARCFWTLFTVALPLVLAVFAFRRARYLLLLPAVLLVGFKFYGEAVEPGWVETERAVIYLDGIKAPFKVAHISDLQTDGLRPAHRAVRESVNAFDPDFIFFTGDVLNHNSVEPEIREYLGGFRSRGGSFFVGGNVDGLLDLPEFLEGTGFTLLDDAYRKIDHEAGTLGIAGLGLDSFADRPMLEKLTRALGRTDATLLLSHLPDAYPNAVELGIDAMFAGHTHGGQVCLPWFGPVLTMSGVPRGIAAGGIHPVDGTYVIVSRGLGLEGHVAPRVRLFCRPHIFLLEIRPKEENRGR
jgi:predicted MPP superfamily phosphohydrolase